MKPLRRALAAAILAGTLGAACSIGPKQDDPASGSFTGGPEGSVDSGAAFDQDARSASDTASPLPPSADAFGETATSDTSSNDAALKSDAPDAPATDAPDAGDARVSDAPDAESG